MRLSRIALAIVAGGLLAGMASQTAAQPITSPRSGADSPGRPQGTRTRDPFEGVVSTNLYDDMARDPDETRTERTAARENRLVQEWSRLRRYSAAYRGSDPFAAPEQERSSASPYREPAPRASRRPGAGDAGWFAGAARGADAEGLRQRWRTEQQRTGAPGASGGWPRLPIVPGQVSPLRTIPDPMLQPPGRGAFGYGQGPGSAGPFGFGNNVITGGDANAAQRTP
jgi:hypothetical protein